MTEIPTRTRAVRILLWISLAWSLVLIAASIWLPVYTLNTNTVGVQPRVSVWTEFGVAGLIPAAIAMVIAVAEMALLVPSGRALSARIISARTLGFVVAALAFVSLAFFHLEGFFFIVFAGLLTVTSWVAPTASARSPRLATPVTQ